MSGLSTAHRAAENEDPGLLETAEAWSAGQRLATARPPEQRFWIGLAIAAVLHALLLIRAGTAPPGSLGVEGGDENSISVDLVTEADLNSTATMSEKAAGDPVAPPAQQPVPEQTAAPEVPVEATAQPAPETPPDTKSEPDPSLLPNVADDLPIEDLPLPGAQAEPKKKPPPTQAKPEKKRSAKLDLSPADGFKGATAGGGGSAGFDRPANITRSGANDAFGRGVIAALQKSMPPLNGIVGRVTVRIVLKPDGNVADVKVVRPSAIAELDDNVLFAARQTPYPFPPPNSKEVDRVFMVTYNYLYR